MHKPFHKFFIGLLLLISLESLLPMQLFAQTGNVDLTIHIRGVYDSNITLLTLSDTRKYTSVKEIQGIKNGGKVTLSVPKEFLPGEFVLRFNYRETELASPYPSEKNLIISGQNLEMWVSPKYCGSADSTWFQKGETENKALENFLIENSRLRDPLGMLQNFLMSYDEPGTKFYLEGIQTYEKRQKSYNQWLMKLVNKDSALFVSNIFRFQYLPQINWKGNMSQRTQSLLDHYFDGMDFRNPQVIKTSELNKWLDNWVNLSVANASEFALNDSAIVRAGKIAIEKAKMSHPLVYGWMVDYFYRGFEANGINSGLKMLEPYINDPNCLTSKRMEIARRIQGLASLVPGIKAPGIKLISDDGTPFELDKYNPDSEYTLLLFWSAGCSHCVEMVDKIYPWQQQPGISKRLSVVAIGLDDNEQDIKRWEQKKPELKGWQHLSASEGVRSKVASDYFVLSTPSMFLVEVKSGKISALPNTLDELVSATK
ncbi:MAG: thioredoxin-like domain-containing protein [Prolixibacteraceae bacterium]